MDDEGRPKLVFGVFSPALTLLALHRSGNTFGDMTRHWSINGRFLTQPLTGVQRYACEIVRALDELAANKDPLCANLDLELLVPPGEARPLALTAIPTRVVPGQSGHIWEQFSLPSASGRGLLSLCNTGPVQHRRQIFCIHDASTRSVPESYAYPFRTLYRVLQPALCRRAAAVTTVSRFSAGELARYHISDPSKVTVVPNGHEHVLRWIPKHTPETREAAGPNTVVIVGSLAPHKNVGLILGLADQLAERGLRIAVVGMRDARVFANAGQTYEADNIVWLGKIDDNALAALMRDSLCLCFPSFTEGFGLPALEAMAIGCPVIATDRASLPEVCGDAALYASPVEPEAWLHRIVELRNTPGLADSLIERGFHRAQRFSWRSAAAAYLQHMAIADGVEPEKSGAPASSDSAHAAV